VKDKLPKILINVTAGLHRLPMIRDHDCNATAENRYVWHVNLLGRITNSKIGSRRKFGSLRN